MLVQHGNMTQRNALTLLHLLSMMGRKHFRVMRLALLVYYIHMKHDGQCDVLM